MSFRYLATEDKTVKEILQQIDDTIHIAYSGNPQGVIAASRVSQLCIDKTSPAIYVCAETDGTVAGTEWVTLYAPSELTSYVTNDDLDVQTGWADSTAFTYDENNKVTRVDEDINGKNKVTTLTYDESEKISSIEISFDGTVRTETYSYEGDTLTGVSVVET